MITILSLVFVLIDQISKIIISNILTKGKSIEVIKSFFYLTYTHNEGAAFSILLGKRIFLILIAIIIIALLIYYIKKNKIEGRLNKISLSLIIGGAFGNLIDRIVRGYVIDFLDFKIFNYNYPIFNLADTFIVIGVILLIIEMIRKERQHGSRSK